MARAPKLTEFEYVLKAERELPAEEQTTWLLRPLTFKEREEVERGSTIEITGMEALALSGERHRYSRRVLNFGLVGWRNFRSEDGAQLDFRKVSEGKRHILPEEILDAIEPFATELSNAITEVSALSRDAAKN